MPTTTASAPSIPTNIHSSSTSVTEKPVQFLQRFKFILPVLVRENFESKSPTVVVVCISSLNQASLQVLDLHPHIRYQFHHMLAECSHYTSLLDNTSNGRDRPGCFSSEYHLHTLGRSLLSKYKTTFCAFDNQRTFALVLLFKCTV